MVNAINEINQKFSSLPTTYQPRMKNAYKNYFKIYSYNFEITEDMYKRNLHTYVST